MSSTVNLVQVLLPDSTSILSASIATKHDQQPTATDLLTGLLYDTANSNCLYGVFGSEYDPSSFTDAVQDGDTWWIDSNGMPWALQIIEVSSANKEWTQDELDQLGDGLLPLSTPVFPFLHALNTSEPGDETLKPSARKPPHASANTRSVSAESGFSDFALSSHLHTPRLRLVCGAPGLSVRLRFAHVPEIYDGWDGRVYFLPAAWDGISPASGVGTTVSEVVEAICEEFGIRRIILQGSKSARIEYALANVLSDRIQMPPPPPLSSQLTLPEHLLTLPGPPDAFPTLYFTISAKWLAKLGTVALGFSKHARRNVIPKADIPISPPATKTSNDAPTKSVGGMLGLWAMASVSKATAPAQLTIGDSELDALSSDSLGVNDDDAETSDTVKGTSATGVETTPSKGPQLGRKKKGTPPNQSATARLSRMFEGWISSSDAEADSSTPTARSSRRITSPLLLQGNRPLSKAISSPVSSPVTSPNEWQHMSCSEDEDDLDKRFDELTQELGIKAASKGAMLALSDDRKRFLIAQNDAIKCTPTKSKVLSPHSTGTPSVASDSNSGLADTLSRASTALAWSNRFSIASITSWTGDGVIATPSISPPTSSSTGGSFPSSGLTSVATGSDDGDAVKASSTGASASLWTSWWGSPSESTDKDDPSYYPRLLFTSKQSRKELVKTLISLRVTLSSAKLVWISAFLDERGLQALERLMQTETQPFTGSVSEVKEMSDTILSEAIKCLRTLMNTEVS
jgi:diaphanous 1